IDEKRSEFVESLAYFSAFQIVDRHCKYTGYESSEAEKQLRYKKIHAELEKITDKSERKEKLVTLLKQQIDSRKNLNFFQKAVGKLMMRFVLSAVTYFAKHFTKTLTASAHGFLMNPIESPLSNGHLVPIKGINNAMLSLLAAEEIWREDTKGELGAESKQEKIFKILNKPNLNGGMEVNELIKEVVRTAINEFLKPESHAKTLKGKIDKISLSRSTNSGVTMLKVLGILGGYLALPFVYLFDSLYSFVLKKGAASLINRLGIVNTVLESMNNSIYTNAKYTSGIDRILLDQLKAVEEMLDQEGGEVLLTEGDNGRRLFGELTSNLFKLLDERGQLSPEQITKRDNLLNSLKEGVNEMADEQLKGIIRDLLIFAYEALRSKDGMNGTVYSILDEANKALQPSDYSRIWLLYDAKEQKKIQQQLHVKKLTVDDLINYFAKQIHKKPHKLVNLDLDIALNKKYSQAESELHLTMERVLNKVVSNVVKTGVGDLLQTPEEVILNHLIWVENQWLPYRAMEHTNAPTYLDEMKKLMIAANEKALAYNRKERNESQLKAEYNQAFEPIKKRHGTYLVQLQNRLKLLESKKGGSPPTDHLISSLTRMAEREMKELQILSEAVSEHRLGDAWEALGKLEKLKRREEVLISAIRFSIESREEGVVGQLTEWGGRLVRSGVKAVAPTVGKYVVGRLNSRAQGVIHMYKDPNVFHSLLRNVVLLNFLNYSEAPTGKPNEALPHAPSDIEYGWKEVD
ncbi:MAG: hypothetical protein KDK60_03845, partial [Chlamydiia bacterium]|nr:hypothetical protein [Chlamydiia bacterium]